jgi:hypothetical protein
MAELQTLKRGTKISNHSKKIRLLLFIVHTCQKAFTLSGESGSHNTRMNTVHSHVGIHLLHKFNTPNYYFICLSVQCSSSYNKTNILLKIIIKQILVHRAEMSKLLVWTSWPEFEPQSLHFGCVDFCLCKKYNNKTKIMYKLN